RWRARLQPRQVQARAAGHQPERGTYAMKRLLIFALILSSLPVFGSGIAFVNSTQKVGGTTGANGSGSIPLTAGNTMLVFVAFYNGQSNNPHVSSVTDSQGDTYTKLGSFAP